MGHSAISPVTSFCLFLLSRFMSTAWRPADLWFVLAARREISLASTWETPLHISLCVETKTGGRTLGHKKQALTQMGIMHQDRMPKHSDCTLLKHNTCWDRANILDKKVSSIFIFFFSRCHTLFKVAGSWGDLSWRTGVVKTCEETRFSFSVTYASQFLCSL